MNRRRHVNIVPVAALLRWVVVAFFLGTAGLCYVYFKNQLHTTGNEIRNLEAQLDTLNRQDETVRAQIDQLSSQGYLEHHLPKGVMIPITDDRIVRVHLPGSHNATASVESSDDFQPVSNRIVAQ